MTGAPTRSGFGRWTLHPPLIAVAWVLAVFFVSEVHPLAAVRALVIAAVGSAILYASIRLALRNEDLAGTLASVTLLGLMSRPIVNAVLGPQAPALLIVGVVALIAAAGTRRLLDRRPTSRHGRHIRAAPGLNAFSVMLLGVVLVSAATSGTLAAAYADLKWTPHTAHSHDGDSNPDIYLILLDGYARGDTLSDVYGFDNTPFLTSLSARGFDVARMSRSNYMRTHLTLSTMFGMDYLDNLAEADSSTPSNASPAMLTREISESPSIELLRNNGYEITAVAPGYEQTAMRSVADTFLDSGGINEFEIALVRLTFLQELMEFAAPDFPSAQHRHRVEWNLDAMGVIAAERTSTPRLVFGHIPSPHTPIVYGKDGEPKHATALDDFFEDRSAEPAEYAGQVNHLNSLVLQAIDRIMKSSASPPVIIIFSDHGPGEFEMDLANPDPHASAVRLRNLFAAYTPGNPNLFDEAITPVNMLASLLNEYLDTDIRSVPDRFFASGPGTSLAEIADPDDGSRNME